MPTYSIKGPDGKTYSLEGPSGATREQVIQEINRQSQQPQQPTDFAANPRQLKDGEGSDFFRGIGQYTDQYGGIMGGAKMLAGKATGSDSLIESGLKQYKKSEAAVGKRGVKKTDSFTGALDEGLGAVLTEFIPYIAGQGVGMIGEAFLTSAAGALIGGSAAPGVGAVPGAVSGFLSRKFVKDGILDQAKKMSGDVKKQFLRNEVAKELATQQGQAEIKKGFTKLGRTGGLTYMAGKFGAGEVTGRAVDEALAANPDSTDQLEIIKGLNTGKLAALSAGHALADYFFLKIGLNSLDAMPAGQASRMAAIFRNIGVTGLKEAPIEAVQTVLEREGANLPLADKEALEEYINAAAAGFFMPIIPATVGGIRAPLAGQPTDTTPGEPTPGEPTPDKAPEAAVETEVDPTSSSVGAAPIDAEVDVDTTEVTETDTEVDDRQGDLFGTEVTETDTDTTEVTETEATPVVALEDAAQEADRQRINAIVNNDLTEQERLQKSKYQTQLELEENQRNLTNEEKALAAGIAGAPIIGDVAAAETEVELEAELEAEAEAKTKKAKTKLKNAQRKLKKAIDVDKKLNTLQTANAIEVLTEKENEALKELLDRNDKEFELISKNSDKSLARTKEDLGMKEVPVEAAIEEEVKKSVEFVGPLPDDGRRTSAGLPSPQPQTQKERDSLLEAQQFVTKRIEARRLKRLGPQETSSGRTFKQEINLDLTPQGQGVATNQAKRDAAQFIKSNNLTNTYGIQEIKNDSGVTTAITVEEKIEVPGILTQKNKAMTTDIATGNLSNFIFLMQPNIDTSNRRKIRSLLENNIPAKQFEYLTRDAKAFGTVLTKVIENIDKKKKAIKEKAELGKEIKKGDVKRIVQPPSDLVREGKRAEEEVSSSSEPSLARKEALYNKNNPLSRRSLITKNIELNADLTEAGTATKALKIIENYIKGLVKKVRNEKEGTTKKITNRINKFGFRNVANLTQMQNILTGVFATLPGLDRTKFKVSKKMKKGVKGTYDTQTDTITISEQNATLETIFHEMTHAATTNELSKHVDVKTGEALTDIGVKLNKIFTAAKAADTNGDFKNELSNIDEFVTEAINNPKFQRFLANQRNVLPSPPTIRTLWAEFVNAVQEMLEMNIEYTLLNDVLAIAPSLIIGPNKAEQKKQPQRKLYQRDSDDIVNNISKNNTRQQRNLFQKAYYAAEEFWQGGQDSINKTIINLQNQSYLIKKWQDELAQTNKLIRGTSKGFNNIYDIMVTSFGSASFLVRDVLQQPMVDYGEAISRYTNLAKELGIKDPQSQLQAWLTGLHEPERREIYYLKNVPLSKNRIMTFTDSVTGKTDTMSPADIRNKIFENLNTEILNESQLNEYRNILRNIANPNTQYNGINTVDVLDGDSNNDSKSSDINAEEYNVSNLNAIEAQTLTSAYLAIENSDPALWQSMQEVIKLQKDIQLITRDLNKESFSASNLSDQMINFYNFQNYIPIKGVQKTKDDKLSQFEITGEMVSGTLRRRESSFEGNTGDAENPFVQTLIDATTAAQKVGRHGLTQAVRNAIEDPMETYIDSVTGKEITAPKALAGKIVGVFTVQDRYGYGEGSKAQAQKLDKLLEDKRNIIHYTEDGSIEVLQINDQALSEAIKTTYQDQSKAMEIVGDVTSFLGQMHTRYNLSFGVTNFVRDFITAAGIISTDQGFGAAATFLSTVANQVAKRGMKDSWIMSNLYANSGAVTINGKRIKGRKAKLEAMKKYADDEAAKGNLYPRDQLEYLTEGGMIAYSMGLSTDRAFEEMNRTINKGTIATKKEQIQSFFDGYMSTFELATRVAAYRTTRDNYLAENAPGVPYDQVSPEILKAAQQSATVYAKRLANFEEIGKQGKTLGALFMFFRPSATGAVRSLESLAPALRSMAEVEIGLPDNIRRNPEALELWRNNFQKRAQAARATIAALGGAGVALVMFSAMLSGDDDEGRNRILTDDSARWNRYARFDISAITGIKGDVFQIPFGFGMGGITALGSQIALAATSKENSLFKTFGNMTEIMLDSFLPIPISRMSPVDNPLQFAFTSLTPTMFRPGLEYALNINTFGQPIYRGGTQSRFGDAYAGGDNLPQLYKDVAIFFAELSNGALDFSPNTLYFWSNAYADGAMRLASNVTGLGYTLAGAKEFNVKYDTQLFNSFFSRVSDIDARGYARIKKEVESKRARINLFKDTNTTEYLEYVKKNPYSLSIVTSFDKMNAQLNKLNTQANIIRKVPGMSPKERTDKLRTIKQFQLMLKKGITAQIDLMNEY